MKFFCDLNKVSNSLRKYYKKINFVNIKEIEKVLSKIKEKKFILDNTTCSLKFENIISYNNSVLNQKDPIYDFKAIKTKKEIQNLKMPIYLTVLR